MGQVYRARDTKLNRDVALKVLPDSFARDDERLARFTREAHTLASLNHPHIAQIYGFEESGGVCALVMELVDGDDLSQRIAHGPVPLDEVLPIAQQVAEALEAAHEQGIIHRDLKPANIKVRPDGTVKVLDFGLAKLAEPGEGAPAGRNVTQSPTITSPAMMTGAGMILGTAAYMSPEQARGKTVDKRADIWAFGVVVFEMLTGQRLFTGETISDTLASVLKTEPNWRALPAATPTAVRRLLRRCLEKDRKRRLDSAADARLEIEEALTAPSATNGAAAQPGAASRSAWARALTWTCAAAALMFALAWLAVWAPWRVVPRPHVTRTLITPSGPAALTINGTTCKPALSPDGTQIVYIGNNGTQLFVRALDALEPVKIASGVGLRTPFFSPDGQWVGFIETNIIRKVAITGGAPITLASGDGAARGATWAPHDTIILSTVNPTTGLRRVSAARGGTPEVLTRPDHAQGEADHIWPELLPGGRVILFTITSQTGGLDTDQVAVRDLRTGAQKVLLHGASHAHYVASGHLVFFAAGTLRAIRFDLTRLETRGTEVPVLPRLATNLIGGACFDVDTDGTLVYVDGSGDVAPETRTLVWVDRAGKETPVAAPPRAYDHPRLSPDGTHVVFYIRDQEQDLWIWDRRRATLTPLTRDPSQDWFPVWTNNSQRVIFSSNRGGTLNLWWQAADGTGAAEPLTTSNNAQFASGITPDGTAVVFNEAMPNRQLLMVALDGTHRVTSLMATKFDERSGVVSPDGQWLAYDSNSSGSFEIKVVPFPNVTGGQWQISMAGGTQPLWARSGKELFYLRPDGALMGVPVEASGSTWNNGTPIRLLEGRYYTGNAGGSGRTYDVSSDGQRFLMIKAPPTDAGAAPPSFIVVQHWDEELKRLVPTK